MLEESYGCKVNGLVSSSAVGLDSSSAIGLDSSSIVGFFESTSWIPLSSEATCSSESVWPIQAVWVISLREEFRRLCCILVQAIIPLMKARRAPPPITPPTITPVLSEELAAEEDNEENVAEMDVSESWEVEVLGTMSIVWETFFRGEGDKFALIDDNEDDDRYALIEDDEPVSDTTCPFDTKTPLSSLQHISPKVPFPRQYLPSLQIVITALMFDKSPGVPSKVTAWIVH